MRRLARCFVVVALGLACVAQARAEDLPISRGIGKRVANFTLTDAATGAKFKLYDARGKKAVVLYFTGTQCPLSNLYLPRLVELNAKYKAHGVIFATINSNNTETAEEVAKHAKEYQLDFAALKDEKNVVADQLLIERTCEALVIDNQARLRFRGAIDDQYDYGKRRPEPKRHYLSDALDALLDGNEIETTATSVSGCPLQRTDAKVSSLNIPKIRPAPSVIIAAHHELEKDAAINVGPVTFAADVASILQTKCQNCHRPGQVAPFSLLTYDHARKWAASIKEVVEDRRMPPWHADPRYGKFENDRGLSPRDRAVLMAWADQGAPLGDAAKLPPPRSFSDGWTIGTPDVVFQIPEPYIVAAQGTLAYQRFRVPTNFTEDKWVQAVEPQPTERSVVHHIIVYVDQSKGNKSQRRMPGLFGNHLAAYAPGDLTSVFPSGTAKRIPAGADLIFEIHYTPIGQVKVDQSKVGMVFAKQPPEKRAETLPILNYEFIGRRTAIPAGADNFPIEGKMKLSRDATLLSFLPHMHLRGKDFKYTARYPDGKEEVLLSVPAYDFAWQSYYRLAEPKKMPKGTVISCLAHFDNSANNPANPNPKKDVRWGEQTWEEMMIGYIDIVLDKKSNEPAPDGVAGASD